MAVEDAPEHVLAEQVPERGHGLQHAEHDGIELVGRRWRALTDVVRHRHLLVFDRLPHAVHGDTAEVDRLAVVVLARRQRHEERLQPESLQLAQGPPGSFGIPPVDQPDPVDAVVGALLHLGDVLVVDAEAALPHVLVRPTEQGQDGVREGQLLGHTLGLERGETGLHVARVRPRHRVVHRQDLDELSHEDRLPAHAEHPAAVDVHDPRRLLLEVLGQALVEDVDGQRDVVVGREHLDVGREPRIDQGSHDADPSALRDLRTGTSANFA